MGFYTGARRLRFRVWEFRGLACQGSGSESLWVFETFKVSASWGLNVLRGLQVGGLGFYGFRVQEFRGLGCEGFTCFRGFLVGKY